MAITYYYDFEVGIDPYRRDTGGLTVPELSIAIDDYRNARVILSQRNPGETATSVSDLVLVGVALPEEDTPDEDALTEYLEGEEATELIERIITGYDTDWSGRQPGDGNLITVLDDDAREALSELESGIAALATSEVAVWTCDEWFSGARIDADTSADEIREYIDDPTNGDKNIRLADDAKDYVMEQWTDGIKYDLRGESLDYENVAEIVSRDDEAMTAVIRHTNGAIVTVGFDYDDDIIRVTSVSLPAPEPKQEAEPA
jgi:hypothetical protein